MSKYMKNNSDQFVSHFFYGLHVGQSTTIKYTVGVKMSCIYCIKYNLLLVNVQYALDNTRQTSSLQNKIKINEKGPKNETDLPVFKPYSRTFQLQKQS